MKNAVCLITLEPHEVWLEFLNTFTNYDVYVVADDNTKNYNDLYKQKYNNINFIQIDNEKCIKDGYKNMNYIAIKKIVTGWEKGIYYFSKINKGTKYNMSNI
jgi:hypothetical protein